MPAALITRLSEAPWKPWAANSSSAARRIACCCSAGSLLNRGRTMRSGEVIPRGGQGRQFDGVAQAAAHDEVGDVRQPDQFHHRVPDEEREPTSRGEEPSQSDGRVLLGAQERREQLVVAG